MNRASKPSAYALFLCYSVSNKGKIMSNEKNYDLESKAKEFNYIAKEVFNLPKDYFHNKKNENPQNINSQTAHDRKFYMQEILKIMYGPK